MCTLRRSFIDDMPLTFSLSGDDLETGLGTPPGALEDQVRTVPIISLAIWDPDLGISALKNRCSGVCGSPQ